MMSDAKYVVIFTSTLRPEAQAEYEALAKKMADLAQAQPGFVRMESVRSGGVGITVSYWDSLAAVQKWKWHEEHQAAQKSGRLKFYKSFQVTVANIEKEIDFTHHGK